MDVGVKALVGLIMSFASMPWVEAETICPNTPGEEIPGMNGLMSGSTEGRVFRAGDIVSCECKLGYVAKNIGCIAHCNDEGTWEAHDFLNGHDKHTCDPILCRPSLPEYLKLGSHSSPPGDDWMVGDTVEYTCQKGYRLKSEQSASVECVLAPIPSNGVAYGTWNYGMMGYPPKCIPEDRKCPDLPELENGELVAQNGTALFDVIEFRCLPGHRMVGDGVARCMRGKRYNYPLKADHFESEWMYVPVCVPICSPPAARLGDIGRTIVTMTTCVRETQKASDVETCEQPVVYKIQKTQTAQVQGLPGVSLVFMGDEVCVAAETVKRKYELFGSRYVHGVGSNVPECKTLCLSACNGFEDITVEDIYRYKVYPATDMKKTIFKLATQCH